MHCGRPNFGCDEAEAGKSEDCAEHFQRLYLASDRPSPRSYTRRCDTLEKNPVVKPYDHPYYWAPFVFTGV